jgi:uncharacterized phage-associated protein
MSNFIKHTTGQIEKIGNSLIYLINHKSEGSLSKKSLLKLIYILEERSIQKNSTPFFNLQYEVWKYGPVAKDIHAELYDDLNLFKNHIEKKEVNHKIKIFSKSEFNNDEFSDEDINILNEVVEEFKKFNEKQLIDYTHREDSLWYNSAKEHNVLEALLNEEEITTEINIDFTKLIQNEDDLETYNSHLEFFDFCSNIK